MKHSIFMISFVSLCLASVPCAADFGTEKIKLKLKSAQHFGAHGFGYNESSLQQLSESLNPEDAMALVGMLKEPDGISVGASFGLAALCKAGLDAVKNAVLTDTPPSIDMEARDTTNLIAGFKGCDQSVKEEASAFLADIDKHTALRLEESRKKAAAVQKEDQRQNEIGLKMLDPAQKDTLTQQEREEAFARSAKALGLEGHRTPEQEILYKKMYKSMVEGK